LLAALASGAPIVCRVAIQDDEQPGRKAAKDRPSDTGERPRSSRRAGTITVCWRASWPWESDGWPLVLATTGLRWRAQLASGWRG